MESEADGQMEEVTPSKIEPHISKRGRGTEIASFKQTHSCSQIHVLPNFAPKTNPVIMATKATRET